MMQISTEKKSLTSWTIYFITLQSTKQDPIDIFLQRQKLSAPGKQPMQVQFNKITVRPSTKISQDARDAKNLCCYTGFVILIILN